MSGQRRLTSVIVLMVCAAALADDPPVDTFIGLPNGGSTTWGASGNWSLGRPPVAGNIGSITFSDTLDRTIVFDQNAIGQELRLVNDGGGQITLRQNAGFNLNFNVELLGGPISSEIRLNQAGFVQTGGTNAAQQIYVGGLATYYGAGTYSLSGGSVQADSLIVGDFNRGRFDQSGGSVTVGYLGVADRLGSSGVYNLSAGTLRSTGRVYIGGDYGNGTFNQTGGSVLIDDELRLGYSGGGAATGTYLISSNAAVLHARQETLGDHSTGVIVQSAGTNTIDGSLIVGLVYAGNYQLSGGTLTCGTLAIAGSVSRGTFAQTGGSVTVGTPTKLSQFSMSNEGTYELSGALSSLTVHGYGSIGNTYINTFKQSAGTATFSVELDVVQRGQYLLSGGTLTAGTELIRPATGSGYGALISQSGGTNAVQTRLLIGPGGNYRLSGGNLSAGSVEVLQGGSLNWSGGVIAAGTASVAGTMTLTPGHNKTLVTNGFAIDSSTGKVDLADNSLVTKYGAQTPASTLQGLRASLAANALYSSVADGKHRIGYADNAVLRLTSFGDQTFAAGQQTQVLATLTYAGDANLDGKVDVVDLGILASHWQRAGFWQDGDSDYSGMIDVNDLGLLAGNWGAGVGRALEPFADALSASGLTDVPEPATASLLGGIALLLPRRTRRLA